MNSYYYMKNNIPGIQKIYEIIFLRNDDIFKNARFVKGRLTLRFITHD